MSHSLSQIITDIGNTTAVPTVSQAAVQLSTVTASYGENGGEGDTDVTEFTSLQGDFEYVDTTPSESQEFYGAIWIVAIGDGLASGRASRWGQQTSMQIQVWKNSELLADVQVTGYGSSGTDWESGTFHYVNSWYLVANVVGYENPIEITSSGLNEYINFTTTIEEGDVISFISDINSEQEATAYPAFSGVESFAQANFVQAINAYGFAYPTGTPPTPAPPAAITGNVAPADLNGDGVIDEEDTALWADMLTDWAAGGEPVLMVTTEEDVSNGNYSFGDLSLREALALAADTNHPGTDTIVFAPWIDEITLTYSNPDPAPLYIGSDVRILGPGADQLTINGNGNVNVFSTDATVTFTDLTITGGNADGYGGGIQSFYGTLTLERVVIVGNSAGGDGGGIYIEDGELTLIDSSIDANVNGGVVIQNSESTILGSTISNNSGGGVVFHSPGGESLTIANSTISGNSGTYTGGLFVSGNSYYGSNKIISSTITNNVTQSGTAAGGLTTYGYYTSVLMHNSIIAGNRRSDNSDSDVATPTGIIDSQSSYNLIGFDPNTSNNLEDGVNGNLVGGEGTDPTLDARLDLLDDYGGRTKTHALLYDSPAINAGDDDVADEFELDFDQRGPGFDRKIGTVDIGAFEYSAGSGSNLGLALAYNIPSKEAASTVIFNEFQPLDYFNSGAFGPASLDRAFFGHRPLLAQGSAGLSTNDDKELLLVLENARDNSAAEMAANKLVKDVDDFAEAADEYFDELGSSPMDPLLVAL